MSNHNAYWGRRYGYLDATGLGCMTVRQMTSGLPRTGTSQNTAETAQSKRDKARHIAQGRPTMYVRGSSRRGASVRFG